MIKAWLGLSVSIPNRESNQLRFRALVSPDSLVEVSIPNRESNQLRCPRIAIGFPSGPSVSIPNRESNQLRSWRSQTSTHHLCVSIPNRESNQLRLHDPRSWVSCQVVSIPNRESNQLRYHTLDWYPDTDLFQSLIGNPINCDWKSIRFDLDNFCFNP